ncbi:hypothetical protein B0T10DRAFT_401198 [Thelonectria olida]|uniref:Uncharacterized protein n=1 Tax=Thelonectria olida TaxID=1576542 RepID=A0A9P8W796_9HYPO|nr:hypothetical protein B0T10DRAFT_401198 [Thelonectria olida]
MARDAGSRTPLSRSRTPIADSTARIAGLSTPTPESRNPIAETTTPRTETWTPSIEATTPHAETWTPSIETSTPTLETTTPTPETATPTPETITPTTKKTRDKSGSSPKVTVTTIETDLREEGWKPLSISTPVLVTVIAFTLLIAAGIETVAQRSKAQGGLALSPSLDEIPTYARLTYLYVPTLIAVIYSIIWSWIDLDVKRMQPWFELSKPGGAQANNSMFLDYQYEFVALVPIHAARRKHWPVFFAGTAMVIVFWLITPLQSAVLGTGTAEKIELAIIDTRSQLQPLSDQVSTLDPEFLNTGYAIGWLNQSFPSFAASEYALLPYYLQKDPAPDKIESNWTATTTKLTTDLECWPAEIVRQKPDSKNSYHFLNGKGCNTTLGFTNANYSMLYVGYHSSAYSDYWLGGPDCRESANNSAHQFLAIWAKTIPIKGSSTRNLNITALFCETSYHKQTVVATVESSNFEPVNASIQASSDLEKLSETEFNSTAFEFVLGNGMADRPIRRDWPFSHVVESSPRLQDTGLTLPVSNMVGFALAGRDLPITDYADEKLLAQVYREAHQYLFSAAVNTLLVNTTDISNTTASVHYSLSGVVVSRVWATTVESLLLVVAFFTAAVLWFCRAASSNLPMNPSSLGRQADLFRDSAELISSFRPMDNADEKSLLEEFKNDGFRLANQTEFKRPKVLVEKAASGEEGPSSVRTTTQKGYYQPVRPLALRRESGFLFVTCLVGIMVGLSYLKRQETIYDGLSRPSSNFEVLQLLENYIPTIIATLIEPFWVLLNRLLCVLQPFSELWEGKAKASRSIDATYTSIPPQLAFWRALKSRHYILSLVCVVSLLANLLAIGLGSLFNEDVTATTHPYSFQPAFAPRFNNESVYDFGSHVMSNLAATTIYQDPMYIVLANMSSGTTLPPWVSQEYYFQRYDLTASSPVGLHDYYKLQTRGFGVNPNCTSEPYSAIPVNATVEGTIAGGPCGDLIGAAKMEIRTPQMTRDSGICAIEYIATLTHSNGPEKCDMPLTMGWARTSKGEAENATVHASFAICRPFFQTAMFNITVDTDGKVISYNRTSELKRTLDYDDSELHTNGMFAHMNHQWNGDGDGYHNDTLTFDWMNYLVVLATGTRSHVDPNGPVPNPDDLIPTIEDIYRRTFVALLGLNEHLFDQTDRGSATMVTRHTQEIRIFMEDASFIITMAVLGIDTVVALIFYTRAVAFVLPRMPTTLGSIIAYMAPSRMMRSGNKITPGASTRTYSFGRYIAYDGQVQLGIEMDPHVVRVDPSSLTEKKGLLERVGIRKAKEVNNEVRDGTWL